jgi:hypothetical protein
MAPQQQLAKSALAILSSSFRVIHSDKRLAVKGAAKGCAANQALPAHIVDLEIALAVFLYSAFTGAA